MTEVEETSLTNPNEINNNNANHVNSTPSKPANDEQAKDQDPKKPSMWERIIRTRPHLFLIFIISVLGFCYHFNIAVQQYWDYKTTVSFSNEDPKDYKFQYPSATVCFKEVVPFFKLKEKYPEYKEVVDKIYDEMKRRNDSVFWNKPESKNFINISGSVFEGNYLHKYFSDKIFKKENILNILEKYSHSYHYDCVLDSQPATKYGYKKKFCENISLPVETINGEFRCFSYFLQLDQKNPDEFDDEFMTSIFVSSRNYERRTNRVYYLGYMYNDSIRSHPFENAFRARIAIHPSDMIPVPEFYPTISLYEYSRFYILNFQKTVSYLLEKPYQTNCFKYELGDPEALQSYDDCFTKCVMNKYRERCKCLPRSGLLYRKSLLTSEDYFCPNTNKCQFANYRLECSKECQPDCVEEKYEFEKFNDIPYYQNNNLTGVQISRKPVFDKVYRHSPSITVIQLICDFGGLGGLWLGFSVITITTAIISLIAKPLEKIVVIKNGDNEKKEKSKK